MKRKNAEKPIYLTKRILARTARKGIMQGAQETMAIMGFNVVAQDGWVVKKFQDGTIGQITQIGPVENTEFVLD